MVPGLPVISSPDRVYVATLSRFEDGGMFFAASITALNLV